MKKAFTLTEVLIVLVILGALALILIPTIQNIMPDDNIIKYRKAFYTLQEIVNDIANDSDVCTNDNPANDDDFFENPLKYCSGHSLRDEVCSRLATSNDTVCNNNSVKITTNGMQWYIPNEEMDNSFGSAGHVGDIIVNLNNKDITSASTRSEADGTFVIRVNPTGKISTTDDDDLEYLTKDPTK